MKYFLSLIALVVTCNAYSQITLVDTPHCFTHVLHAEVTGGLVPTSSGITVDDGWSGVIPIGFTYNFYGVANTSCIIGSNGCVGFNLGSAGAYNTWPIGATLATTTATDIRNVICGPWCDVFIPAGGTIEYSTQGVAPNRNFAVTWCGTRMYSCTTEWLTTQIIIYETSGLAEVHINHRTICSTGWNGSHAIVGVKNSAGTVSTVAPGRDFPAVWVVPTPEAWRFTPAAGPTYTVGTIPYAPIPYAASAVYWYDSATHAYLGSGPDLTVAPTVTTTYMAAVIGCNDTLKAYIRVNPPTGLTLGGLPHIDSITFTNTVFCGNCNGEIVLHGVKPHQVDSIFFAINGVAQPVRVDSAGLDSTIHLTGLCAGVYNYFYIKVGDCPSNTVGPVTLTVPPFVIRDITFTNPDACGQCNGTITLYGLHPLQTDTINYTLGGVPQPPHIQFIAPDSLVVITGLCAGTYDNFIANTGGVCISNPVGPVTLTTPPLVLGLDYTVDLGCNGDYVYFHNLSTPGGAAYVTHWDFGDGDTSNLLNPVHVYTTQGTFTVHLHYATIYGCVADTTFTIPLIHPINAQFTVDANAVCLGMPIHFDGTTVSTNQPTFEWNFGNGMPVQHTTPVDYIFPNAGFYTVTFTVTDTIGCQAVATDTFDIISVDVYTSVHDTSVCLYDSMSMRATITVIPDYIGRTITWTPTNDIGSTSDATTHYLGLGTTVYTVTVTTPPLTLNPNGCVALDTERVNSYPPLTLTNVTASPVTIPYGGSIQLNANGAVYYTWTPTNGSLDNNNISNPIARPTDARTVYTVYGMNLWGCLDSAQVIVNLDNDMPEGIPTAFTPNNDGNNDVFKISKLTFQNLVEFRVFNRWGQELFYTNNKEVGWDGTFHGVPQDLGVYNWVIIVGHVDGSNKVFKGSVTLIR